MNSIRRLDKMLMALVGVFLALSPAYAWELERHWDTDECPQVIPGTTYTNAGSADGAGTLEWPFNINGTYVPHLFTFKGGQLHVMSPLGTSVCIPGLGASNGKNQGAHFIQVTADQVLAIMKGPANPNQSLSSLSSTPWNWENAITITYIGPNPAPIQGSDGSTFYAIGARVATLPLSAFGLPGSGITGITGDTHVAAGKRPAEVYFRRGENVDLGKLHLLVKRNGEVVATAAGAFRLGDSPVAQPAIYNALFPPIPNPNPQLPPSVPVASHNGNSLKIARLSDGVRRGFTTSIIDTRVRTNDPNKRMKWVGDLMETNQQSVASPLPGGPTTYMFDHHNTGCCHNDSTVVPLHYQAANQNVQFLMADNSQIGKGILTIGGNSVTVRGNSSVALTLTTEEDAVHYQASRLEWLTQSTNGGQSLTYGRVKGQPMGAIHQGLMEGLLIADGGTKAFTINGALVATVPNGANGAPIGHIGSLLGTNWAPGWGSNPGAGAYTGDRYGMFGISGSSFTQQDGGFYMLGSGSVGTAAGVIYANSTAPYPINFTAYLPSQYLGSQHGGIARYSAPTAIVRNSLGGFRQDMLVSHSTRSVARWSNPSASFSAPLTATQEMALWAHVQQSERGIDGSAFDRAMLNVSEPPTAFKFGAASPDCAGTKLDADVVLVPTGDVVKVSVRNASPNSLVVFAYGKPDYEGALINGVNLLLDPSAPFGVDAVPINAQGKGELIYGRPTEPGEIGGQFFMYNPSCPTALSTAASDLALLEN